MTQEQEERMVAALELLAKSAARTVDKLFPEPKVKSEEDRYATVTRLKTPEEEIREAQRADAEDWPAFGPR